jgi:quercetin dioxygenase-like cupin family protein
MNIKFYYRLFLCFLGLSSSSIFASEVEPLISKTLEQPFNEQVEMITVTLSPGESSIPHRHNAHTLIYMLQGKIETKLEGDELVTLTAGDSFYESPADIHVLTRNTSTENEAKFLVVFVKEKDTPKLIPLNKSD